MWTTVMVAHSPPSVIVAAKNKPPSRLPEKSQSRKSTATGSAGFGGKKKDPVWQCIQNCGACCKLDKGPQFPSPDEIFDEPSDVELYQSLIGKDGWCIHYDKNTRECSIYADSVSNVNSSCCVDTIKAVYGIHSEELEKFNRAVWSTGSKMMD
ncbi:uncharacterized protein LOC127264235 isoform X2 [Andrographis paniculata]|uniref:uncharacterized protein LOC127264235 isoform X2 n=1 Tax=Andrographis paniculata TaxID=175694 RepID=UPI0021E90423|nr:uncharacterized protein LOC127264235 isoform X2 [Andrographis paniculata]